MLLSTLDILQGMDPGTLSAEVPLFFSALHCVLRLILWRHRPLFSLL